MVFALPYERRKTDVYTSTAVNQTSIEVFQIPVRPVSIIIDSTVVFKLPRSNLRLDPRAIHPKHLLFDCYYHDDGITVTLKRVHNFRGYNERRCSFKMRVFDPEIEVLPDFNSKTYVYLGVDGDYAPDDTIVGIIDPSVKILDGHKARGSVR